jgi:hypothetical protein
MRQSTIQNSIGKNRLKKYIGLHFQKQFFPKTNRVIIIGLKEAN